MHVSEHRCIILAFLATLSARLLASLKSSYHPLESPLLNAITNKSSHLMGRIKSFSTNKCPIFLEEYHGDEISESDSTQRVRERCGNGTEVGSKNSFELSCRHSFCMPCLHLHKRVTVENKKIPFSCPDAKCQFSLLEETIKSLMEPLVLANIDSAWRTKYEKLVHMKENSALVGWSMAILILT